MVDHDKVPDAAVVAMALNDLSRAAENSNTPWALIGGQALRAYGVPRHTLDADALVPVEDLLRLADVLVVTFHWKALKYSDEDAGYVVATEPTVLLMDDPVLFDVQEQRNMIALESNAGLVVELLAAQHPVEMDMVTGSGFRTHEGILVPVAPLGGILLVKTKADRSKDRAAIEQTAEHLSRTRIDDAIAWADKKDPATADDLRALVNAVHVRRRPNGTSSSIQRKR